MDVEGARAAAATGPAAGVVLDPSQRAVLDLAEGDSAVVLGAPGTGKTTTAIELIADLVLNRGWHPSQVLALTTARATATRLRDALAARVDRATTGPLARTVNSLAFELVGEAAAAAGSPVPRLLTGGEQDADIAGLLDGHRETGAGPRWPESLPGEVLATRRFRTELRELMARATEYGIDPRRLRELGAEHDRPEWTAAADFIQEYLSVVAQARPTQLDSAELAAYAVRAIQSARPPQRVRDLRLVVLDDGQEATEGSVAILRALVARGVAVVAFGDPDVAVNSFRGGDPDVLARLDAELDVRGLHRLALGVSHRQPAALRAITARVVERIGTAGAGTHRNPRAAEGGAAEPGEPAVARLIASGPARQWAQIARVLRERHLRDAVPWDRLAVIVRSRAQMEVARRALARAEVPVRTPPAAQALRDDPAARALLRLLEVALGREELTAEVAEELLTGPFGGLDPLQLRRLRRALRVEELAGGGNRTGATLLADALGDARRFATIRLPQADRAGRIADLLARLRVSDGTIEELLWLAWDGSGRARHWQAQALGDGPAAGEANRNLDGIVALFTAAKRFAERRPADSPRLFLEAVLDADVPEDTLSPQAADAAVLVTTPPGVVGLGFDTVVVAGLQDGAWPDLRLRGSLLHPQRLVRTLAGLDESTLDLRALVRDDEWRMFALAVSRASARLVLAAVSNDELAPSPFFRLLGDLPEVRAEETPLTLRGITGRLRRLVAEPADPRRAEAARTLAALAAEGVRGADPAQWHGLLAPSSTAPLYDGEPVRLSPSALKDIDESALDWFVDRVGSTGSGVVANVGTLIHSALETAPPQLDALWAAVQARWGELEFESWWLDARQLRFARVYTEALAAYLRDTAADGVELIAPELQFEVPIEAGAHGILLRGEVDRIERVAGDGVRIVDLKTGRLAAAKEVGEHLQLRAYQLGYADGGFGDALPADGRAPTGGASLLFVKQGREGRSYWAPVQDPQSEEALAQFRDLVRAVAERIAVSALEGPAEVDEWGYDVTRTARRRLIRVPGVTSD